MAKRKLTPKQRVHVVAKCVGCGAIGLIGPGHTEQPMCGLCLMPMIATKATRRLKGGR